MKRKMTGKRKARRSKQGTAQIRSDYRKRQFKLKKLNQRVQQQSILWHYTTGQHFDRIVASGELRPRGASIPGEGKPAVWFTDSEQWERTADKMISVNIAGEMVLVRLNTHLTHVLLNGLVRFGVAPDAVPHTWRDYKLMSGVSRDMAEGLCRTAVNRGSTPAGWRVSFEAIPRSMWLRVEFWSGTNWSLDPNVMPKPPTPQQGSQWIADGLESGEVVPAISVRTAGRLGIRVGS